MNPTHMLLSLPLVLALTGCGEKVTGETAASVGCDDNPLLIDDMEGTISLGICSTDGRTGYWDVFNDGSGTQSPAAGDTEALIEELEEPSGDSTKAIHSSGSGFSVWGAGVQVLLSANKGRVTYYDGSAYKGIAFWAKRSASSHETVRVQVTDRSVSPGGGICTNCNDNFGTYQYLETDWKRYEIRFDEMRQEGFGDPEEGVNTKEMISIEFLFNQNQDFDIWLDDLEFIE